MGNGGYGHNSQYIYIRSRLLLLLLLFYCFFSFPTKSTIYIRSSWSNDNSLSNLHESCSEKHRNISIIYLFPINKFAIHIVQNVSTIYNQLKKCSNFSSIYFLKNFFIYTIIYNKLYVKDQMDISNLKAINWANLEKERDLWDELRERTQLGKDLIFFFFFWVKIWSWSNKEVLFLLDNVENYLGKRKPFKRAMWCPTIINL